jgi:hypothetical protein
MPINAFLDLILEIARFFIVVAPSQFIFRDNY